MESSPDFARLGLAVLIALVWFVWERGRKIRFAEEGRREPAGPRRKRAFLGALVLITVLPRQGADIPDPASAGANSDRTDAHDVAAYDPCEPRTLVNAIRDMIFWQRRAQKARLKLDVEGIIKAENLVRAYALDIAQCPDEDKVNAAFQQALKPH